jgi:hypothetical protein
MSYFLFLFASPSLRVGSALSIEPKGKLAMIKKFQEKIEQHLEDSDFLQANPVGAKYGGRVGGAVSVTAMVVGAGVAVAAAAPAAGAAGGAAGAAGAATVGTATAETAAITGVVATAGTAGAAIAADRAYRVGFFVGKKVGQKLRRIVVENTLKTAWTLGRAGGEYTGAGIQAGVEWVKDNY